MNNNVAEKKKMYSASNESIREYSVSNEFIRDCKRIKNEIKKNGTEVIDAIFTFTEINKGKTVAVGGFGQLSIYSMSG